MTNNNDISRREFLATSAAAVAATGSLASPAVAQSTVAREPGVINFAQPDSLFHGEGWETLNPGYWQIKNGALRRRLKNVGDRARRTGFPFHSQTAGKVMETEYDPSLPAGIIYRNDWKLRGSYTIRAEFTYLADRPEVPEGDDSQWKMYQDGYGQFGIALGAKCVFESYNKTRTPILAVWGDNGSMSVSGTGGRNRKARSKSAADALSLKPGDRVEVVATVKASGQEQATVEATFTCNSQSHTAGPLTVQSWQTQGYFGIVGRGLVDFEVNDVSVDAGSNKPLTVGDIDCYACYPLGATLKEVDGQWNVRFVGLFTSDGVQAEIRIADSPNPVGGWRTVPVAGSAPIVNHEWRRNTAVIHADLPTNPAHATLYYTVWKDGKDVTVDPRIGTAACGPGTGLVGDVPSSGQYVGRLPQLTAPYKLCGLSCHALTSGLQQRTEKGMEILGGGAEWQFRDQPTVEAYKHLEDYNFQIMVWEDDVWYMELILYPPSTDDAYKIVKKSICGPTSRWQMMRHWNVINPGDHDYGMDDVKGPEQLAIRRVEGLGQDVTYMRRNFQIVHHLITGEEEVDPLANPKKWRAWKMPNRDFTFVILDSRLWRSSQDVDIWDDAGWGAFKSLYDRTDPTRSLLGEEQFAWFQELLATDSSRLIGVTGVNGMHTVWTGRHLGEVFSQRSRVAADYAGWVKAGSDRVLELMGGRDGVVTVYGDVHNGCIMKNIEHGVIECSFGPIGRSGGREVIPGFGPKMKDFDGRDLEVHSLYHKTHADMNLGKHSAGDPFYWNFLEMEFDTRPADARIGLRVRNLIDSPTEVPRGGGSLETLASRTGRTQSSGLPKFTTLPNADVRILHTNGRAIRGIRSAADGSIPISGLVDVAPGTQILVTAFDGERSESQVVTTTG